MVQINDWVDETPSPPINDWIDEPMQGNAAGHYAGLAYRAGVQGITAIPTLIANIPAAAANLVTGTYGAATGRKLSQMPYVNPFAEGLDALGVAQPRTASERVAVDVGSALTGTGVGIKMGQQAIRGGSKFIGPKLAAVLSSGPKSQMAGAALGAGAAGVTRESGGGTGAQLAAGLAGSLAPYAAGATARGVFRGGPKTAARMRENISAFQEAGTTPSIGQATESRVPRATENLLAKIPGGAGVMTARSEKQASQVGSRIDQLASGFARSASAEQAGRAIHISIKGNFIPKARGVQESLYNRLDKLMNVDSPVNAENTINYLKSATAPIKGAENLSKTSLLKNQPLSEANVAINKDVGGTLPSLSSILDEFGVPFASPGTPATNQLPYRALKELRTRIGMKLEDIDLAPDIPKAQLKQLYAALSRDMESAAKAAGPEAYKSWQRANWFTRAFHDRVDRLQVVIDKGDPEKVFKAALSGAPEGATTIRSVMRSIPMEDKKLVTATFLRRLGRATPGRQDDVGNVFSSETFLTNWNRISPQAKDALLGGYDPGFRSAMDKVAKYASNLRQGSKVFVNPSGTASASANIATVVSFVTSLFTGNILVAAGIGAGVGGANLAARAYTNPTFVKWLARNTDKNIAMLPAAINSLNVLAGREGDPELEEIANTLQGAQP